MSSAKEILEERLAKGEISVDEYDLLITKISNGRSRNNQGNADTHGKPVSDDVVSPWTKTKSTQSSQRSWFSRHWWWVLMISIIIIVLANISNSSFEVVNPKLINDPFGPTMMTGRFVNKSNSRQSVYVWVLQGDRIVCVGSGDVAGSSTTYFDFNCNEANTRMSTKVRWGAQVPSGWSGPVRSIDFQKR